MPIYNRRSTFKSDLVLQLPSEVRNRKLEVKSKVRSISNKLKTTCRNLELERRK